MKKIPANKNLLIFLAVLLALGIFVLPRAFDKTDAVKELSGGNGSVTPQLPDSDTYNISSNEPGPKAYKATFAPLGGAIPGVTQKVFVSVRHDMPIKSISVNIIMDGGSHPISLKLDEGTDTDGVWIGEWIVNDTHNSIYQAEIKASSGKETSKIVLTFLSP